MEYLLGIDLGTTNCTVTAIDENGKIIPIKNKFAEEITPSAVYFNGKNILVGKQAKEKSYSDPKNLVLCVKREMGNSKDKVRYDSVKDNYNLYEFGGKIYSPEEISALILKQLKADAENQLNTNIKKAVITCPAYFGDKEKSATRTAGSLAGFDVLEIIPEPTAASLLFASKTDCEGNVLVFDLGGGTFDVTVLNIDFSDGKKQVKIISTSGDHKLGGKDWDNAIIDYCCEQFDSKYFCNLYYENSEESKIVLGSLQIEVEKAKENLFKNGVQSTNIEFSYGGRTLNVPITRQLYSEKTKRYTDRLKTYCNNALSESNFDWQNIDTILMIGSMSRCSYIQDLLEDWSCKKINFGIIDPKTCVSEGAALKAFILEGGKISSFDEPPKSILSHSIGIQLFNLEGKLFIKKMLNRNSEYPNSFSIRPPLKDDYLPDVTLKIYEGEDENPENCNFLGSAKVILNGKLSKKDKIEITLSIDKNGILQIEAKNQENNIKMKSIIQRENIISDVEEKIISEELDEFYLG